MTTELTASDSLAEGYDLPQSAPVPTVVPCRIGGNLYGIPIRVAGDMVVLTSATVTPISFAPSVVRGAVVQKGRMATVIDGHIALGLPPASATSLVGLTVEYEGHVYVLTVDEVGELAAIHDAEERIAPLDLDAIFAPRS